MSEQQTVIDRTMRNARYFLKQAALFCFDAAPQHFTESLSKLKQRHKSG